MVVFFFYCCLLVVLNGISLLHQNQQLHEPLPSIPLVHGFILRTGYQTGNMPLDGFFFQWQIKVLQKKKKKTLNQEAFSPFTAKQKETSVKWPFYCPSNVCLLILKYYFVSLNSFYKIPSLLLSQLHIIAPKSGPKKVFFFFFLMNGESSWTMWPWSCPQLNSQPRPHQPPGKLRVSPL